MNEKHHEIKEDELELFLEKLTNLILDECIEEERIWMDLLS